MIAGEFEGGVGHRTGMLQALVFRILLVMVPRNIRKDLTEDGITRKVRTDPADMSIGQTGRIVREVEGLEARVHRPGDFGGVLEDLGKAPVS